MTEEQLREKILKALCCDPKCGHEMEPEICIDHQVDRVKDIFRQEKERLLQDIEGMKLTAKNKKYDGNDLSSAADFYMIAAESWDEIIRYENGYNAAVEDVLSKIRKNL